MSTLTVVQSAQSLRGQSVIVSLSSADMSVAKTLPIGQLVKVDSSNLTGTISYIDSPGSSIKITPIQPDKYLNSDTTPGILSASDTISTI